MTKSDAEKIYNELPAADKHLMGIIGVVFAYEYFSVIWQRLFKIFCNKEDLVGES